MITFMDYLLDEFTTSTEWNLNNSYSSLTATSDALLAFATPSNLSLHVSSLSSSNFGSAYTLSTLGQIDGSVSYLYSTVPLGHLPSQSPNIPLRRLIPGYRDIRLPAQLVEEEEEELEPRSLGKKGRKPTILHATMLLPPPSTLTALYARRIDPRTLLSVSLNSRSSSIPAVTGPPSASLLGHLQHDAGRYSIEALASTDSGLMGIRALCNFGVSPTVAELIELREDADMKAVEGSPDVPITPEVTTKLSSYHQRLSSKPSLLSAGAEFYYSPFSHVIGLSTGLRFTTLVPHIRPSAVDSAVAGQLFDSRPRAGTSAALSNVLLAPSSVVHSSFPYTMTLTMTPLTGSLASTYSVKPSETLALSSQFDFNVYSWESQYVIGAEIWQRRRRRPSKPRIAADGSKSWPENDSTAWAHHRIRGWFNPAEQALKDERREREEENVLKICADDRWNVKALWSGRIKSLLVNAGVTVGPVSGGPGLLRTKTVTSAVDDGLERRRWTGSIGVSIAYST